MFMKKGSYLFLASSILASTVVTAIPPSNGIVAKAVDNQSAESLNAELGENVQEMLATIQSWKTIDSTDETYLSYRQQIDQFVAQFQQLAPSDQLNVSNYEPLAKANHLLSELERKKMFAVAEKIVGMNLPMYDDGFLTVDWSNELKENVQQATDLAATIPENQRARFDALKVLTNNPGLGDNLKKLQQFVTDSSFDWLEDEQKFKEKVASTESFTLYEKALALRANKKLKIEDAVVEAKLISFTNELAALIDQEAVAGGWTEYADVDGNKAYTGLNYRTYILYQRSKFLAQSIEINDISDDILKTNMTNFTKNITETLDNRLLGVSMTTFSFLSDLQNTFFSLQTFIGENDQLIQWSTEDLQKITNYITAKQDFQDALPDGDIPFLNKENPLPEWDGLTFVAKNVKDVTAYAKNVAEYVKAVDQLPSSSAYADLSDKEKEDALIAVLKADELYEKLQVTASVEEPLKTLATRSLRATGDETFKLNRLRKVILAEQQTQLTDDTEVKLAENKDLIERAYALYQNGLTSVYNGNLSNPTYAATLQKLKGELTKQKVTQFQTDMNKLDMNWKNSTADNSVLTELTKAYADLGTDVDQLNPETAEKYKLVTDLLTAKVVYDKIVSLKSPYSTTQQSAVTTARKEFTNLSKAQQELVDNIATLQDIETYLKPLLEFETKYSSLPSTFSKFASYEANSSKFKEARSVYETFSDEQKTSLKSSTKTKMQNLITTSVKYDYDAIEAQIEKIANIDITESYKKDVKAVRVAYDALDNNAKLKVTKYAKLTDAEDAISKAAIANVTDEIAKLPNSADVTEEQFEDVQKQTTATRQLVDQLTATEKQSVANMQRLVDLETFLLDKTLLQIQKEITALPTMEAVAIQHIEAITTVAKKFDALTATQQDVLANKDKIEQLKNVLPVLNKANNFVSRVGELPSEEALTLKDETQLNECLQLFSQLDEQTKVYVPEATQKKLIRLHVQYVQQLIEALPAKEEVHLTSEGHIQDVRAAYEAIKNYEDTSTVQLTKLVEAEEMIVDLKAANTVQQQITALPAVEALTISDQPLVQKVRVAYDALSTRQKTFVVNYTDLQKREAQFEKIQATIQAVEAQIAALPTVANVQLTDEEAIQAARAAFQALAADAQARVSNEAVLQKVEEQLLTLKELAVGQTEAVKSITKIIDTLPKASTITLAHQTLIQTTYDAFVALSAIEQKNVTNAFDLMVAKALIDDLVASEVRKKSVDVMTKIAALPAVSLLDVSDEPAYLQAQFAYDVLTEVEKKAVTNAETLPKIAAQLVILKQDVTTVKTMIANLPLASQVSETNREAIEKARRAYESLTVAQKKMVTNSGTLEAVELKLAENQTARVRQVVETIQRLPVAITMSQEKAIANARAMYDALTLPNQVLVTNYTTLLDAEAQLDTLIRVDEEAARKVETLLYELPFTIVASDEATVTKARKAYNKLTVAQRLYVTNVELLEQAEAALVALAEKDVAAAQKVVKAIDALPTKAKLKLTNATALKAARTKYSALKTTQKQYVDNYDVLLQLETQMVLLQKRDKALKVKDIDIDIPTIKNTTKVIQGYVTPKAKVVVYKGTTKIKAATVDSKGFYKVTIPAQKAKTVLSFVIYNELGDRLVTKKVTVQAAKVSAAKTVKATPQKVTGKATKNTSVSIYKGTKKIRTTKVTTKGTFAVSIPKQKKGTVLKIIVADTAGNKSTTKRIQVR